MPPWMMELLLAGGGLGLIAGGVREWFKYWRESRQQRAAAAQSVIDKLEERIAKSEARAEALWLKVESQLNDARMYERENTILRAERMNLDKQFASLVTTMIAALERSEALIVKLTSKGS